MPLIELSRFYPAEPDLVFEALVGAISIYAKLRSSDDYTRSVNFATKMSGWASGANLTAQVVPHRGGVKVQIAGQAKVRSQINANNAAHRQIVAILDAVSADLRDATAQS